MTTILELYQITRSSSKEISKSTILRSKQLVGDFDKSLIKFFAIAQINNLNLRFCFFLIGELLRKIKSFNFCLESAASLNICFI